MKHTDFNHITYFTCEEVEATGADIEALKYETIHKLDMVRSVIGLPISLQVNGLTSGNHSSKEHPRGEAVDFYLKTNPDPVKVVLACASFGFRGIGVYLNKATGLWQYHMDTRKALSTWYADKVNGESWKYKALEFSKL
jgi:hypothetical protein